MGAWGVALYSDDTALDAKDTYEDCLKKTQSHAEALRQSCEKCEVSGDEKMADTEAVFWFAIAERQWFYGVLFPEVKAKALEFLSRTEHLEVWEESGAEQLRRRKTELEKLKVKLLSPLPPVRKIPKIAVSAYKSGDVVAVKITDNDLNYHDNLIRGYVKRLEGEALAYEKTGDTDFRRYHYVKLDLAKNLFFDRERYIQYLNRYLIFHVAQIETDGTVDSLIKLFYWCGNALPSIAEIEKMNYMPFHVALLYESGIHDADFKSAFKESTDLIRFYNQKAKNAVVLGNIPFEANGIDVRWNGPSTFRDTLAPAFYNMYDELQRIGWDGKSEISLD